MSRAPLPDQAARDRILSDLGVNLLVEAGAGSGKTTALVGRMLELVRQGVPVEGIAAVTFTRKAAGELARRFRQELERALREAGRSGDPAAPRLEAALRDVDRGFAGTIHAFCARLLRERPLSARVDPGFSEISGVDEKRLQDAFWASWLDELHARRDPILDRLRDVGLAARELKEAFRLMASELADVTLEPEGAGLPDFASLRSELEQLLAQADNVWPVQAIEGRRDKLQNLIITLKFLRNTTEWDRAAPFFAALEAMSEGKCAVTQKLWSGDKQGKTTAKKLGEAFAAYVVGPAADGLREWYAHRYDVLLDFLLPLRHAFEAHRHATGRLTFQDLLILAARLLREDRAARGELGRRFPRLLVDEFQDTDPLQAEVCFLLASDPSEGADWRTVRLRQGALFVVGDPKQSIYRFRRADIEIYEQVRQRFTPPAGDVVELTCNFRSAPRIGAFVDAAFARLFPATANARQAAFAPFNAQQEDAPTTGVYRYEVCPDEANKKEIGRADARAVASWIAAEVAAGRSPGDFLVIPAWKEALPALARELERRNLPVTVTGADLTVEPEMNELLLLLSGLADPGNEVLTLAVLEGLFFGIDPQQLWEHRRAGGSFSFERGTGDTGSAMGAALAKLHEWSRLCREWPIDAALARIVGEAGLLPMAAASEMGESRAGALAHVLEIVNAAAARGAADLRSAIAAVQALRESPDVEAPLRPGRTDSVRLMNLHKAKGLEAKVVVLPYPAGNRKVSADHRVARAAGKAMGWCEFQGERGERVLGRPRDWSAHARIEEEFLEAERVRLLYVAATRAREMLVVGQCPDHPDKSTWQPLSPELGARASALSIAITPPESRRRPAATVPQIADRITEVDATRDAASVPAFDLVAVTESVKGERESDGERLVFRGAEGRGREWGTLVHRAIAAMGRGRSGASLRSYCRAMLLAERGPGGSRADPEELPELLALLDALRASPVWAELNAAADSRWELAVTGLARDGDRPRLRIGTVDAAALDVQGKAVRIVDWKTDVATGAEWDSRIRRYDEQVRAYIEILADLTGGTPRGTVERVGGTPSGAGV
jgi:ATP-dependent helicase/nuclease subunit A